MVGSLGVETADFLERQIGLAADVDREVELRQRPYIALRFTCHAGLS
jgi:hypothetical protein